MVASTDEATCVSNPNQLTLDKQSPPLTNGKTVQEQPQESEWDRQKAVAQWIEVARDNASAARRLVRGKPLRTHALYWVQQSMESATKALARSKGKTHEEVYGHNFLELLFATLQKIIEDSNGAAYANHMISQHYYKTGEYDSVDQLRRALTLTSSPTKTLKMDREQKESASQFYESALTASAEEVHTLLELWDRSSEAIWKIPRLLHPLQNRRLNLDVALSNRDPSQSLIRQIQMQCLGDGANRELHETEIHLLEQLEEVLAYLIETQGQPRVVINGNQIIEHFDKFIRMQAANLGILTIGGIVWPHESYPRYPAPPGARNPSQKL